MIRVDHDRGVVAMQPLGGERIRLDEGVQRRKRAGAAAYPRFSPGQALVRQRR